MRDGRALAEQKGIARRLARRPDLHVGGVEGIADVDRRFQGFAEAFDVQERPFQPLAEFRDHVSCLRQMVVQLLLPSLCGQRER
jgi:hypothetical protein